LGSSAARESTRCTRGIDGERLLLGVYVDDLIITGSSTSAITKFKEEMSTRFSMSDLGLLKLYVGIKVE
jgi:hypothetical protein